MSSLFGRNSLFNDGSTAVRGLRERSGRIKLYNGMGQGMAPMDAGAFQLPAPQALPPMQVPQEQPMGLPPIGFNPTVGMAPPDASPAQFAGLPPQTSTPVTPPGGAAPVGPGAAEVAGGGGLAGVYGTASKVMPWVTAGLGVAQGITGAVMANQQKNALQDDINAARKEKAAGDPHARAMLDVGSAQLNKAARKTKMAASGKGVRGNVPGAGIIGRSVDIDAATGKAQLQAQSGAAQVAFRNAKQGEIDSLKQQKNAAEQQKFGAIAGAIPVIGGAAESYFGNKAAEEQAKAADIQNQATADYRSATLAQGDAQNTIAQNRIDETSRHNKEMERLAGMPPPEQPYEPDWRQFTDPATGQVSWVDYNRGPSSGQYPIGGLPPQDAGAPTDRAKLSPGSFPDVAAAEKHYGGPLLDTMRDWRNQGKDMAAIRALQGEIKAWYGLDLPVIEQNISEAISEMRNPAAGTNDPPRPPTPEQWQELESYLTAVAKSGQQMDVQNWGANSWSLLDPNVAKQLYDLGNAYQSGGGRIANPEVQKMFEQFGTGYAGIKKEGL